MDVDYRARPNIKLLLHGDYTIADYNQLTTNTSGGRYDQYLTLKADMEYDLTSRLYVGPSYQFVDRWSNQVGSGYTQNVFMLRLGSRI